jgi:hypothetical protein
MEIAPPRRSKQPSPRDQRPFHSHGNLKAELRGCQFRNRCALATGFMVQMPHRGLPKFNRPTRCRKQGNRSINCIKIPSGFGVDIGILGFWLQLRKERRKLQIYHGFNRVTECEITISVEDWPSMTAATWIWPVILRGTIYTTVRRLESGEIKLIICRHVLAAESDSDVVTSTRG